jgi:hypothetical protein
VSELALDDVERHALAGELKRMRVASWWGANLRLTPAWAATRRNFGRRRLTTVARASGRR